MKHELFKEVGLMRMADNGKYTLYGIPKDVDENQPFEVRTLPFLTEPQTSLVVYPKANLIVTQDKILTLDGHIVLEHKKDEISVVWNGSRWMIIQDSKQNNDVRYRIMFWDGKKDYDYIWGRYLLQNDKYFAVCTLCDMKWCVYTSDGAHVMDIDHEEAELSLEGNFLVLSSVGSHSVYSLLAAKSMKVADYAIFAQQPLVLASKFDDFAICANLQGEITAYYRGKYFDYGKVEKLDLYDQVGLIGLKIKGRFFLYRFNGEKYAENICPLGADAVAYNEEDQTLLIDTNGVWYMIKL